MSIDKGKLLENFKDIKNIANFDFLICYKKLFKKEGFVNNIGCFLILGFILFHILSFFIFNISNFPKMKKRINKIASKIYEQQPEKEKEIKEKKRIYLKIMKFSYIKIKEKEEQDIYILTIKNQQKIVK